MKWFTGTIPEAISLAKSHNTLFVVYIHDDKDASKSIFEALDSTQVSNIVTSQNFVAIKLKNGETDAIEFAQIYPLIVVPSLFFINSDSGLPLEIVAGSVTPDSLMERINKLPLKDQVEVAAKEDPSSEPTKVVSNTIKENEMEESVVVSPEAVASTSEETKPEVIATCSSTSESTTDDVIKSNDATQNADIPLEVKIDRAHQLLLEKQHKKEEERKTNEMEQEIERRNCGPEMITAKEKRDQEEAIAAAKNYRKVKKQDQLAREEIKRRIQADKEEREARAAMIAGERPVKEADSAVKKQKLNPTSSDSRVARLKFRLPDGSSHLGQFSDTSILSEVQDHVRSNIRLPSNKFNLTSTLHQRPFDISDMTKSLRDLGLVPSAIIIITPVGQRNPGAISTTGGSFLNLFWFILTPITVLMSFVQRLIGLGGPDVHTEGDDDHNLPGPSRQSASGSGTTRNRPKTAYGNRTRALSRQEGNIHRFQNAQDHDDDDDDQNTWNGNSTQQM